MTANHIVVQIYSSNSEVLISHALNEASLRPEKRKLTTSSTQSHSEPQIRNHPRGSQTKSKRFRSWRWLRFASYLRDLRDWYFQRCSVLHVVDSMVCATNVPRAKVLAGLQVPRLISSKDPWIGLLPWDCDRRGTAMEAKDTTILSYNITESHTHSTDTHTQTYVYVYNTYMYIIHIYI